MPLYTPGSRDMVMVLTAAVDDAVSMFDLSTGAAAAGINVDGTNINFADSTPPHSIFMNPENDFFILAEQTRTYVWFYPGTTLNGNGSYYPALTGAPQSWTGFSAPFREHKIAYPGSGTKILIPTNNSGGSGINELDVVSKTLSLWGPAATISRVAISEQANRVAVAAQGSPYAFIYDYPSRTPVALPAATTFVGNHVCCAVSPTGRYVAFAAYNTGSSSTNHVTVYDMQSNTKLTTGVPGHHPRDMIFSLDGTKLIVAGSSATGIRAYTIGAGTWAEDVTWIPRRLTSIRFARYSTDRRYFLVGEASVNQVHVYDSTTWAFVRTLTLSDAVMDADVGTFFRSISNADTTPVVDKDGNPVQGVTVRAYRQSNRALVYSTTTDANGRFTIPVAEAENGYFLVFLGKNANEGSQVVSWVYPT